MDLDTLVLRVNDLHEKWEKLDAKISAWEIASAVLQQNSLVADDRRSEESVERVKVYIRDNVEYEVERSKMAPLRKEQFWVGVGSTSFFIVFLTLLLLRGKPPPNGPVLPILCAFVLALGMGCLAGTAAGKGGVGGKADTGAGASGQAKFDFSITGGLVGFLIGGIVAVLLQKFS